MIAALLIEHMIDCACDWIAIGQKMQWINNDSLLSGIEIIVMPPQADNVLQADK